MSDSKSAALSGKVKTASDAAGKHAKRLAKSLLRTAANASSNAVFDVPDFDTLKFDDKGLIPAIVQDAETREVLTLAYMNRQSLAITIAEARTCFWSRSRQELWRKGETSGNVQHVVRITADCDRDALVVEVEKEGPACHLGTESCFTRPVFERPTQDLHNHTTWSDGEADARAMIESAIARGLRCFGISDHSYTDFDESYCMKRGATEAYLDEVRALAEEYRDRIEVLCGIEQDFFSAPFDSCLDYAIGSVHYVEVAPELARACEGCFLSPDGARGFAPVDEDAETFARIVELCFDGDPYAFAEAYFAQEARLIEVTKADIIGHFDLITKYNEGGRFFDEGDSRYVRAWQAAADALLETGRPFEVNYGAVRRGMRTEPYPAAPIRDYLIERGATLVFGSDSHSA